MKAGWCTLQIWSSDITAWQNSQVLDNQIVVKLRLQQSAIMHNYYIACSLFELDLISVCELCTFTESVIFWQIRG